jgi:hypothetical protein
MYKLSEPDEKEEITENQTASKKMLRYQKSVPVCFYKQMDMVCQKHLARKYFFPYLSGGRVPERPKGSGRSGFYINHDDYLAFKGLGCDMSLFFAFVMIPKLKHGYDNLNDKIVLASCRDITTKHVELFLKMKAGALEFIKYNRDWFYKYREKQWLDKKNKDIDYFLKEENIQFGFHWPPSIGYIHLHVLVGPLTCHGEQLRNRWISLDSILRYKLKTV